MKLTLPILLLTTLSFTRLEAQQAQANVEAIIQREMKERAIPGLQVAVVQKGKIVFSKNYGTANIQYKIPVSAASVFPINSCTKVFTAVAVMQLMEDGKISLSASVSAYLDSLPTAWQQVTIAQLLTHTSGIPDMLRVLDPVTGGVGALRTEKAVWEKLKTMPMDFQPGEQFRYNQTNGYLLGKIILRLSGQPFNQFFADRQFTPAGMTHTFFGDTRDVIPGYAPTYHFRKNQDGRKLDQPKLELGYYEFPDFTRTTAGINTSAEDFAHWVIALQSGKLLKNKASLDSLWSPSRFNNGAPTQWSMGWGVARWRSKYKAIGMSGGGRSAFLVYPEDDLAVIVLTNLSGGSPEDYLEELAGCYIPGIAQTDPITFLRTSLRTAGYDQAITVTDKQMRGNALFKPNEQDLNDWAYRMMNKGQLKEALAIFKLNVHLFPASWNVYDSYGEALLASGSRQEAITNYKRSVELNPQNDHGKKVLDELLK